jgi:hypothetical protein
MTRRSASLLSAALAGAALAAGLALPGAAEARKSYCSPTGDYCKGTYKKKGKRFIELRTAALYAPPARYRLCVRDPRKREACRTFRLRKKGGVYVSKVRWSRHFPTNGGKGRYRVRWDDDGFTYGPPVHFRRR